MNKLSRKDRSYLFLPIISLLLSVISAWGALSRMITPEYLRILLILNVCTILLLLVLMAAFYRRHIVTANSASEFEHQAYTDALTQVKNRAAFVLVTNRLNSNDYPHLTLIMADLNNLKQVNDTLGHPVGDQMICLLASYLEQTFGPMGSIYRWGGDEFLIVIEDTPLADIAAAREQFDRLIEDHRSHGGLEISTAMGIASRQDPHNAAVDVSELMRLADLAMYQYKTSQKAKAGFQSAGRRWLEQIDAATGIMNFTAFKTRLYDSLARRSTEFPCIVNFDLNCFDGFNDIYGWDAGNHLLQQMTVLAMNLCGKNGFCAHSDADSFWVFADQPSLEALTARIEAETKAFQNGLDTLLVFPSFGIYCINDHMAPVSDMCGRATVAKREIKGRLNILYNVYSNDDRQRRTDWLRLTSHMQHRLDTGSLPLCFQPIYSAADSAIIGAEAVVRWERSDDVDATAKELIAITETSGLILALDWYIVRNVCIFLRRQLDAGLRCVPVSVNLSMRHIEEPDCADRLRRLVDQYQLPRHLIRIHVKEASLSRYPAQIADILSEIRSCGFQVILDNFFGLPDTIQSLEELAVDGIKLDASLLGFSNAPAEHAGIPSYLCAICHAHSLSVIADGVSDPQQAEFARSCGCDGMQGALYSAYIADTEFEATLQHSQSAIANAPDVFKKHTIVER